MDKTASESERLTKESEENYYKTIEEIAHELRNPLNIMRTSVYLLKKAVKESIDDVDKYIYQLEDSIRRSDNIITNILNKDILIKHKSR